MARHVGAHVAHSSADGGGGVSNVTALKPRVAEQQWLSPEQVCERIPGMTLKKLEDMRHERRGMNFYKPTQKTVVYSAAEVDEYVRATRVSVRER